MIDRAAEAMTPEEYEQFKQAEKEHLKKLKELRNALRVLERQKRIQSALDDISRSTDDALETQRELVERLALETAHREARLEVALDASADKAGEPDREALERELRRERAWSIVDELKASIRTDADEDVPERHTAPSRRPDTQPQEPEVGSAHPTEDREERPGKTIGRM